MKTLNAFLSISITLTFGSVSALPSFAFAGQVETYVITASAARMRTSPSLTDEKTHRGSIYKGQTVQVVEKKSFDGIGTWLKIKTGKSSYRWINHRLAKKATGAQVAAGTKPAAPKAQSFADGKPADGKPADGKPADPHGKPVEANPAEIKPAASAPPAGGKPAEGQPEDDKDPKKEMCINKITQTATGVSASDLKILKPLIHNNQIHPNWGSGKGTAFQLGVEEKTGLLQVSMSSLSDEALGNVLAALQTEAQKAGQNDFSLTKEVLAEMVKATKLEGRLCIAPGPTYAMVVFPRRVGGDRNKEPKKTYRLVLKPLEKGGFDVQGDLMGAKIAETFSAQSASAGR